MKKEIPFLFKQKRGYRQDLIPVMPFMEAITIKAYKIGKPGDVNFIFKKAGRGKYKILSRGIIKEKKISIVPKWITITFPVPIKVETNRRYVLKLLCPQKIKR